MKYVLNCVQLRGRLVAPDYSSKAWRSDKEKWVQFSDVDGLTISGGGLGVIDGKGSDWWKACDKSDCDRPAVLICLHHLMLSYN